MRLAWNRINTVLLVLVLLVLVTALAKGALGGPLDPPAPPGSTMKSLELVPGSWMRVLDSTNGDVQGCSSSRFACVLGGAAVLDLETGLVWQRDGGTLATTWTDAISTCYSQWLGGKWGWRLPTFPELMTLASGGPPVVAGGSPFTNVGGGGPGGSVYWTASVDENNAANAWAMSWGFAAGPFAKSGVIGATGKVLCVRAGTSMATD